jgi:VCBS repeat-containing protein
VTDLDLTDSVTSAVTSVVASGTTNGLQSNNAALLAMLTSTPNVLDNTELTDQLTWAFNSGSEHFNYLAVGQSLVLTYTVTVTDSQAATDTQTVVITINGTNDAPVISVESGDSAAASLTETNATLATSGTLTVTDLDLTDTVTSAVTNVVATGSTNGLQSNNTALLAMLTSTPNVLDNTELTDQLTWAFNSGSEHFNYLAAGQSLVLTYTITVTDSQAATDTQTVMITINGTNDAPVISVESGDSAAESLTEANATLSTGGTLTVTDLDLTDTVASAVTSVVASGTTNGLGSNNAALLAMLTSTPNVLDNTELTDQLTWAFNSGSEHFNYLAAGQSLVLTYAITVTDSQTATDTQTIVITINGTNDAPVISVESGDSAAESLTETNATLSTGGTLTVTDLDLTDAVTSAVTSVVASGMTTGLGSNNAALLAMLTSTPNVLDSTELTDQLTWAFNSGSEHFNYLAAGQSLVLTYTITVTDSQAATDTQTVVITINGTNDAPVISVESGDSAAASLTETNATLATSGTLTVTDLDLTDTVASAVTSVVASGTTNGLGSNNAALLAMLTSTPNVLDNTELTDQLTWAFNSGSEHFNYLAADQSLVLTYTITVTDSQVGHGHTERSSSRSTAQTMRR